MVSEAIGRQPRASNQRNSGAQAPTGNKIAVGKACSSPRRAASRSAETRSTLAAISASTSEGLAPNARATPPMRSRPRFGPDEIIEFRAGARAPLSADEAVEAPAEFPPVPAAEGVEPTAVAAGSSVALLPSREAAREGVEVRFDVGETSAPQRRARGPEELGQRGEIEVAGGCRIVALKDDAGAFRLERDRQAVKLPKFVGHVIERQRLARKLVEAAAPEGRQRLVEGGLQGLEFGRDDDVGNPIHRALDRPAAGRTSAKADQYRVAPGSAWRSEPMVRREIPRSYMADRTMSAPKN